MFKIAGGILIAAAIIGIFKLGQIASKDGDTKTVWAMNILGVVSALMVLAIGAN
jgi:hypothetical protein